MRRAIVENGVVVNMIVADDAFVEKWMKGRTVIKTDPKSEVSIGWPHAKDASFTKPAPVVSEIAVEDTPDGAEAATTPATSEIIEP